MTSPDARSRYANILMTVRPRELTTSVVFSSLFLTPSNWQSSTPLHSLFLLVHLIPSRIRRELTNLRSVWEVFSKLIFVFQSSLIPPLHFCHCLHDFLVICLCAFFLSLHLFTLLSSVSLTCLLVHWFPSTFYMFAQILDWVLLSPTYIMPGNALLLFGFCTHTLFILYEIQQKLRCGESSRVCCTLNWIMHMAILR